MIEKSIFKDGANKNLTHPKAEKGITLVALIITIIVLLILAVVAINAVRDDGIIEYAKNARTEYEKAQDEEQALLDYYTSQIQSSTGKGTVHGGIISKDATYTTVGGETLTGGEKFPETPVEGDVYIYGHYEYTYYNTYTKVTDQGWTADDENMNGWRVKVRDKSLTEYGEILTTINGANVKSLLTTFYNCSNLIKSPTIPSTVVDMRGTFQHCTRLESMSIIPDSVKNLYGTFSDCVNLTTIPNLPNNSTGLNLNQTFYGCKALTSAPAIPSTVTDMTATFYECEALKGYITINALDVSNYASCFHLTKLGIELIGVKENGAYKNQTLLTNLAGTSTKGNVTIAEIQ